MKKGEYDPKEHAKALYSMELHETIKFSDELYVTRVPGGWIYERCMLDEDKKIVGFMTSVFIPFSSEFKTISKDEMNMEISVLGLSIQTIHCLIRNDIKTVKDLYGKTDLDLLRIRNIGKHRIKEIKYRLKLIGLTLKEEKLECL